MTSAFILLLPHAFMTSAPGKSSWLARILLDRRVGGILGGSENRWGLHERELECFTVHVAQHVPIRSKPRSGCQAC